jgi:hypothetical protein
VSEKPAFFKQRKKKLLTNRSARSPIQVAGVDNRGVPMCALRKRAYNYVRFGLRGLSGAGIETQG